MTESCCEFQTQETSAPRARAGSLLKSTVTRLQAHSPLKITVTPDLRGYLLKSTVT
jgi:hypothetical protein